MSTAKKTFLASWICLATMLAACSNDQHVFYSSVDRPTNITIYDPLADKPLWIKEIPVGQRLELDFDRGDEKELEKVELQPATALTWSLFDNESTASDPIVSEQVALPGTPVLIKVNYRPSPEYPTQH